MAEDLTEIKEPMDFHPCDTPRGMLYYNMDILTNEQQKKLNALKIETIRENQKYLAQHPEIRACVAIISRLVLKQKPRTDIYETIAEYFSKSRVDIEADVDEYINNRHPYLYEATSGLNLYSDMSFESVLEEEGQKNLFASHFDSSESVEAPVKVESTWQEQEDLPDIETSKLQLELPDSLKNIGVNYNEIKQVSSDAIVNSISIITQTAEEEKEEEKGPYTGHIPTIEDYDAGYGRQKRIFESGQSPLELIKSPALQQKLAMKQHHIDEQKSEITSPMEDKNLRTSRVPDEMNALKSEDEEEELKLDLVESTRNIEAVGSLVDIEDDLKGEASSAMSTEQIRKQDRSAVSKGMSSKSIDDAPKISKSDTKRTKKKGDSNKEKIKRSHESNVQVINEGEIAQKSEGSLGKVPRKSSLKNVHATIVVSKSQSLHTPDENEEDLETKDKLARKISFGAVLCSTDEDRSSSLIVDSLEPQTQNSSENVDSSKTEIEDVPQE